LKIWIHNYLLQPVSRLGRRWREAQGALLKLETEGGKFGYSDLHPLPEFGDAPIAEQLKLLKEDRPTELAKRSMELALKDARARAEGRSLLVGAQKIKNHYFLFQDLNQDLLDDLVAEEFTEVKMKMGQDLIRETKALRELTSAGFKVRPDFNCSVSEAEFVDWLARLPSRIFDAIDFIEDPFFYNSQAWAKVQTDFGVSLAFDLCDASPVGGFSIEILKPARRAMSEKESGCQRFVFTHSMDHPLGQMAAAAEAIEWRARSSSLESCGLLAKALYRPNEFSECMVEKGGRIIETPGTGYGFDSLLEKTHWTSWI
jgi:O-succinylbenzoate synthase